MVIDNSINRKETIYNFIAMLRDHSDLSKEQLLALSDAFAQGSSGNLRVKLGDTSYYLVYEGTEIQNWTLLGLVPVGIVKVEKVSTAAPGSYDLLLMDVQMPVMDGYTATRQIRALDDSARGKLPILAMTANAFDEDRRNALESGMTGFLSKPIVIGDLVQELRKIL